MTTLFMLGYQLDSSLSNGKIEEAARGLGMHYDDECKVFFKGENVND